jgi:hypothetical protein
MKLYPNVFHSPFSGTLPTRNFLLRRLTATLFSLGCISALSIAAFSSRSGAILEPSSDDLLPPQDIALGPPGIAGQVIIDDPGVKVNAEAFNRLREKQIAEDSSKLLSLAIEVKTELAQTPGDSLPPDAVRKIKEIEKLAHTVKQKMQIDPGEN